MTRVYNFSAGPATLPEPVLRRAAAEMLDYRGLGISVMEMSHRSPAFDDIIKRAEAALRRLLAIPEGYTVLFLQGGAALQFAMVPLNLLPETGKAAYVHTGVWSKKAIAEARRVGEARVIASSEDRGFAAIPEIGPQAVEPDAAYVHITTNNTIYGTAFDDPPDCGEVPLAADMSSDILSKPIDVAKYGLIYAGAQKNAGPAGVTIVILRNDLIGRARPSTPAMLDYATHAKAKSLYNTPPCYAIYIAGLVFEWLEEQGGLAEIARRNRQKAALLYDCLDRSRLFRAKVQSPHRSRMNVVFTTDDDALDKSFVTSAESAGLLGLKGHRLVGGMRASMYNAMPVAGAERLAAFMARFEAGRRAS